MDMADLDFDELDRAVNSLIASSSTPNNIDTPKDAQSVAAAAPAVPAPVAVEPSFSSLASRRTGRFMDMVTSNSSSRPSPVVPERPTTRQGVTVSPIDQPITVPPRSEPAVVAPAEVITPSVTANNTWPAPGDLVKKQDDEIDDIDKISDAISDTLNPSSSLPESPFLADAKVDKRPLGAFSITDKPPVEVVTTTENTPAAEAITVASGSPDSAEEPKPTVMTMAVNPTPMVNMVSPLPAELREDLLSIESESTTVPVAKVAEVAGVASTTPQPTPTEAVAGGLSIAQQYTEKPSTSDQTIGSIYNTDAYHKSLINTKKAKSGWMWVIWTVVLLIVGAGAGAAAYFLILK